MKDITWMMKNILAKLAGLLLLSVVIGADKLPSEVDIPKINNEDYSLFAAKSSPTSEELQIPKYLSFEELNTLEDILGSFSDLDLQSYLPPSSVLSDFSPPSPHNAYSAPLSQTSHSAPSAQAGYAAPHFQLSHSSLSGQSSYNAVPAVQTDSFALFDSPKEGKQLGSYLGSFPDSYSSTEVAKGSPNSLLSNHGHSGGGGHDKGIKGMPYEFGYAVKDEYTKNDYGHKETSNGDVVTGEYRVLLPDGRTQIVSYTADHIKGYQANVRYEGEAKFPEPSPKQSYGSHQGKQLQQSYNSLGQEGKQEPYKQFQFPNPLPLESHSRDLPEPIYSVPKPQLSHTSLQPQQNFIPPQPQLSYSPPHQSLQTSGPPKLQNKYNTPPKSQKNHNSSSIKQVVVLTRPLQNYLPPKSQQNLANPQQTNLQQAFDPPKPQESYTQPILQENYAVPEPRQSFSLQNRAPALHQQGFIIPQPQQRYSSPELQQNYLLPEHPNQNLLEPQTHPSQGSSESQQGFIIPQPQQRYSSPELQQNNLLPERPNQNLLEPQTQPSQSSSESQQGFIIPQPQQRYSSPELQQNYLLPEHPNQNLLEPQPQPSQSSSESQQGFILPQPLQSFEIPHPQTNPSSSESFSDPTNTNNINLNSIAQYLPPSQSQSVLDSTPQLDTSYLPPIGSNSGSLHRKRSAASVLYRKSSPSVVIRRSQKIPLQFESLKNKKNSKKDSFIR